MARLTGVALGPVFVFTVFAAWVQHFITTVTEEMWVLLVVGAIVPPVGVLHVILVWIGVL